MNSKIFILSIILIIIVTFNSCIDDNSQEDTLIGSWKLYAVTAQKPIDINEDDNFNTNFLEEYDKCYDMNWEFRNNGNSSWIVVGSVLTNEFGEPLNNECEPLIHTCIWETNETNTLLYIKWKQLLNIDISHYKDSQIKIELINNRLIMKDYVTILEDNNIVTCDVEFRKD